MTLLTRVDVIATHSIGRNSSALNTITQIRLLTLVIKTFHSVLDFVQRLFSSVKSFETDNVETVADEV